MNEADLHQQIEALGRTIGAAFPDSRPIEMVASKAAAVTNVDFFLGDDRTPRRADARTVLALRRALGELRDGLYRPGAGTWFRARVVVTADERADVDFDYDAAPEPDYAFPPQALAEDFERYPRDPENTPAWLADALRAAGS